MKAKTLQIVWHCKEPVLTVDFSPTHPRIFATGGADKDIKLWEVVTDTDGSPAVSYVCSMGGLTSSVNIVRFSPLGDMMVSGGDKGEMMLWKPVDATAQKATLGQDGDERAPTWRAAASLRAHTDDVSDVAWSPDGSALATASVDNDLVLWDVETRRAGARLHGHQHYVQGVCWDPLGWSIITLSNDRTAKVFASKPATGSKKQQAGLNNTATYPSSAAMIKTFGLATTLSRRSIPDNNDAISKAAQVPASGPSLLPPGAPDAAAAALPAPPVMPAPPARHPLFQDENLNTFFRRPAWSPDGSFVVLPAGVYKQDVHSTASPTAYIFVRGDWSAPVAQLPSLGRPPVVARFSPILYTLRAEQQASSSSSSTAAHSLWEHLPYRMVWAVGTLDSVLVYETHRLDPILLLGGLHMAPITDLSWSCDGTSLLITSMDGYCSMAVFDSGELGEAMQPAALPPLVAACVTREAAVRHADRQAKLLAASREAPKSAVEDTARPAHAATPLLNPKPQQQPPHVMPHVITLDADSPIGFATGPCVRGAPGDPTPGTPRVAAAGVAGEGPHTHTQPMPQFTPRDLSRCTPRDLVQSLPVDHTAVLQDASGVAVSPCAGLAMTPGTSQARRIVPTPLSGSAPPMQHQASALGDTSGAGTGSLGGAVPRRIVPVPVAASPVALPRPQLYAPALAPEPVAAPPLIPPAATADSVAVPMATGQAKRRICPTPAGPTSSPAAPLLSQPPAAPAAAPAPAPAAAAASPAAAPAPAAASAATDGTEVTASITVGGGVAGEGSKPAAQLKPNAGKMSVAMMAALAGRKAARTGPSDSKHALDSSSQQGDAGESGQHKKQRVEGH